MRFLHISDLHFGKMMNAVSMLENGDQPAWTDRFLALAGEISPDAVVIAGDVYDRSAPSGEAMQLFSRLVTSLAAGGIPVLIVAGNHDSGQRLSCFSELLCAQNVHIAGVLRRELTKVTLRDAFGPVHFWLLPYVFPAAAAHALNDDGIRDYDTAVRRLLAAQEIDFSERNVIVAHQNVTVGGVEGPRGGSESTVGGVGQVEHTAFDGFEYAALGHIHAAYPVGREGVRYAGTPLCYHFDELKHAEKGPVLVELGEKGAAPVIKTLVIPPLHPLRELRGTYDELRAAAAAADGNEYVKLVLTDRPLTPEVSAYFQALFDTKNSILMERLSTFSRFDRSAAAPALRDLEKRPVETLFAEFYTARNNGEAPDGAQLALLRYAAELAENAPSGDADGAADKIISFLTGKEA